MVRLEYPGRIERGGRYCRDSASPTSSASS